MANTFLMNPKYPFRGFLWIPVLIINNIYYEKDSSKDKKLSKQLKDKGIHKLGEKSFETHRILEAVIMFLNGEVSQKKVADHFDVCAGKLSRYANAYRDRGVIGLEDIIERGEKKARKADTSNDQELAKRQKGEILL